MRRMVEEMNDEDRIGKIADWLGKWNIPRFPGPLLVLQVALMPLFLCVRFSIAITLVVIWGVIEGTKYLGKLLWDAAYRDWDDER